MRFEVTNIAGLRFDWRHLHEKVGNLVKEILSRWEGPQDEGAEESKEVSDAHDFAKDPRKAINDSALDFDFHGEIEDERVMVRVGAVPLHHVKERLLVEVQVRELSRLAEKLDNVVCEAYAMLPIVDSLHKCLFWVKLFEYVDLGDRLDRNGDIGVHYVKINEVE